MINLDFVFRSLFIVLLTVVMSWLSLSLSSLSSNSAGAGNTHAQQHKVLAAKINPGSVYPQFRSCSGVIHWLPEQMPLKVYVAQGKTVEKILDPSSGVSAFNVDNLDHWTDLMADILENPETIAQLPIAEGYLPEHYQAALAGISSWKAFEKEGLFSFVFTDDPADADIYVFWVSHFIDKLGWGLYAKDIRGLTAKRAFSYAAIQAGKQPEFKPVISLLRTTTEMGEAVPFDQMRARAAHEFGHALGIEGHSGNPQDLMSVYYGRGVISPNDAATVRYLYHSPPDLVP